MTQLERVLSGIDEVRNSGIQCPLENVDPHRCFHFPEKLIDDIVSLLKAQQEKDELQKEEMAGVDAAFDKIIADARDLLKKTTPRVMTPEDFNNNSRVDGNGNLPCWVEYRKYNGIARPVDGWGTINRDWVNGYRDRRFWTTLPTDEQREAIPWKE